MLLEASLVQKRRVKARSSEMPSFKLMCGLSGKVGMVISSRAKLSTLFVRRTTFNLSFFRGVVIEVVLVKV